MKRVMSLAALALLSAAGTASGDVYTTTVYVPSGGVGSIGAGMGSGIRYTSASWGGGADRVMRLLDPLAVEVASNDDSGPGLGSAFVYTPTTSGPHNFQISRYPDFTFAGNGGSAFISALTVCDGPTGGEVEGNDTYSTANLAVFGTGGSAMDGTLTSGDVDYYAISGLAGEIVMGQLDFLGGIFDTMLGLFDANGVLLTSDDDGGFSPGSASEYVLPASGTYYWAVTGYGDFDFNGSGHSLSGSYRLIMAVVPAPGAGALLGLAGLVGLRRRR